MNRFLSRLLTRFAAPVTVAAFMAAAPAAQAGVLFSDNFDSQGAANALSFNGFTHWAVTDGTVDYIRSGVQYGINCVGNTGGCVDLDGSTLNAGVMSSKVIYDLLAGTTYFFSLDLSGGQVRDEHNTVNFGFALANDLGSFLASDMVTLARNDPFGTYAVAYTPGSDVSARLVIGNAGGDNVGLILDNVVLTSKVPEPGTLALLGLGLAAIGLRRRRAA
ncbi:MAG: PEP-CTERM sorting domain-containing protein [Polaromonas sp.]|uniref:PEP-CTERM sorting domain-containing protein n=1 Tax=Comamonadaceae TaxID=80864 RepID=UPI0025C7201E|nr:MULTISPECIES: PEP-CTERM sorting domain-containing protein [Comamonadaceae]MDO9505828.1 PEP-CTERM sorting domain-containing protein [Hydrogenophaga sp.]MDP2250144.1 PEP-CTERM sorting domain-containing protein [Hydrogenophaga sp.]MDP2986592.1 PEP-CTERM sorting domain-containing protein [Hydrogenophaga sp.]MDP3248438.1 PEP-CTERM sorting domain-containing protein [Polaromonas sp.]MDP3625852.1 PEP-CTERM sorting domain-containing protein [Hydrogenophaga sp.]